ncbi:MAG: YggS family pyridoxal phosphate-dependent enzyme [Deltaproteobacteria bacterium]|nr:YggS family pyridoxal phosphate-dependent enzyme [Deltaproteobacteria bacterium]
MTIKDNVQLIKDRIARAARRSGREPGSVRLMAVTKTVNDDRLDEAIATGIEMIGENYVQEAKAKIERLGRPVEWHMIGHLQTNKAKYAVKLFDMIHSVDSIDLALELDKRSRLLGRTAKILIEVNLSGEKTKSGVTAATATDLVEKIAGLGNLSIQGLMTMPPWFEDPELARPYYADLRKLRDRISRERIAGATLRELSMGMTDDYEIAVEEGATIVRIGRGIFGERPSRRPS